MKGGVVPPGIEPGTQGFSVINRYTFILLHINNITVSLTTMANAVEKTKSVFKLILNLSVTTYNNTYKVLSFCFMFHHYFYYMVQ